MNLRPMPAGKYIAPSSSWASVTSEASYAPFVYTTELVRFLSASIELAASHGEFSAVVAETLVLQAQPAETKWEYIDRELHPGIFFCILGIKGTHNTL